MKYELSTKNYKSIHTKFGDIRYAEIGQKGNPVILFSTGGGASYDLVYAFEWLAKEGYRLIAVNRPGYFDLPLDVADSIEDHAAIYYEVIKELGITESVNVFGISMGGLAALYYAKNYPTKSLVLWSAVTGKYEVNNDSANSVIGKLFLSSKGKNIVSKMMLFSAKYFPEKTAESFLKTEADLSSKQRKQIAKEMMSNIESKKEFQIFIQSTTPMALLYDGMMDEVAKAEQLTDVDWTTITCPTLSVHSTIDIDVPISHSKRLKQMIPNLETKYVKAGGHFVWWGDEGKVTIDTTLEFFNRVNTLNS